MKNIILSLLLLSYVYANKPEKQYWDEVKNSSDIELLKSYKKQYPHGTFEKIADIKIKRLRQNTFEEDEIDSHNWIKGNVQYQFYGIGKANKHYKGMHYQENLARGRAKKKLMKLYNDKNLSNKKMIKYNNMIETKQYIDDSERIYIMLYVENPNLTN